MQLLQTPSQTIEVSPQSPQQAHSLCEQLERGQVLLFREVPFAFPDADRKFLLARTAAESRFHKNISYRPASGVIHGSADASDRKRLLDVMQRFSREASNFVAGLLAPYAGKMQLDFASFRPLEEQGRDLPLHKRNDLLHVDAFPTRPTRGGRILRIFVNINPAAGRVWNVGAPFHTFVPSLLEAGSRQLRPPQRGRVAQLLAHAASQIGLPVPDRSHYDEFMLYLHDWLKENAGFQKDSPKREIVFPSGSCWMVYTDGVPHAVMSGQFAVEQTFIVPLKALVAPEASPLRVLESATGRKMN
jgi:3-deoxy-D-manno-oct-2-ulosonic acid (Kdo) hydroxylase